MAIGGFGSIVNKLALNKYVEHVQGCQKGVEYGACPVCLVLYKRAFKEAK